MKKINICYIVIFIIIVAGAIYGYDKFNSTDYETKYNQLLDKHEQLSNRHDSLKYSYDNAIIESDSIISYYTNKLDSTIIVNNNIKQDYEEKLKDINDITIVSNDSVTEYISSRIYN